MSSAKPGRRDHRLLRAVTARRICHTLVFSIWIATTAPAQASTVYRCADTRGRTAYQALPCAGDATRTTQLAVADRRTAPQVAQALDNRRRDGFEVADATAPRTARKTRGKKAVAAADSAGKRAASKTKAKGKRKGKSKANRSVQTEVQLRPGALSSHRLGERPFEHVGTPLSAPAPVRKKVRPKPIHAQGSTTFTARVPAPPAAPR